MTRDSTERGRTGPERAAQSRRGEGRSWWKVYSRGVAAADSPRARVQTRWAGTSARSCRCSSARPRAARRRVVGPADVLAVVRALRHSVAATGRPAGEEVAKTDVLLGLGGAQNEDVALAQNGARR